MKVFIITLLLTLAIGTALINYAFAVEEAYEDRCYNGETEYCIGGDNG
jgi:hypothetical protein